MYNIRSSWAKKIAVALCVANLATASLAISPNEFIRYNSEKILAIIRWHDGTNSAQICEQVRATSSPWFDFARITALAVGQHWNKANPTQQAELIQAFQRLLINTYTNMVTGFKNAQIDIRQKPRIFEKEGVSMAMVSTQVTLPKSTYNQKVLVDYALYKSATDWKIFNISIEGISLVTAYRRQFNNEILKNGIEGLIQTLHNKNRQLQ